MTGTLQSGPVGKLPAPRLEAPWFGGSEAFVRMARVLDYTARVHCPEWVVNVSHVPVQPLQAHDRAKDSHVQNTQKMEQWNAIVQGAADGERILLMDADTFITRPLYDVWEREFDLAYTSKDSRFPFNSGVMFLRVSAATKAFFEAWAAVNREMLTTASIHAPWRERFGGINQAAFGRMLESGPSIDIAELPCREWNCEDSAWAHFDPEVTRIVHVKSALRRYLFPRHVRLAKPGVPELAELWTALEREACEALSG